MILKEVAVENYSDIPAAVLAGANRIELNDNLAAGGTTVSYGVMAEAAKYLQEKDVPLVAMIRPRGGNFVYNDIELKIMEADLFKAQELGIDSVAIGCLMPDNTIDEEAMEMLIGAATGMEVVFHMAFDEIAPEAQEDAIKWLSENGVSRILTHGGSLSTPIDQTVEHLKELIALSEKYNISILPGGGITHENVDALNDELNISYFHGTKILDMK